MTARTWRVINVGVLLFVMLLLLMACQQGGGGGAGSSLSGGDFTNVAPVAVAGADVNYFLGTGAVTLDGSASSDADQDALTFQWNLIAAPNGSTAAIVSATSETAQFTPDTAGQYEIELAVNDGKTSATDSLLINAADINAPTVNAGADLNVNRSSTVTLDGSGSSDPQNLPLTYTWTQIYGPDVTVVRAH